MQLGKRGFPYPILNNAKNFNCYINSTYSLEFEEVEDGDNYILKNIRIETNSDTLKELLNQDKAKAMVMIECSATLFKYSEEISLLPKDIIIPINKLSGRVEISSITYATETINELSSDDFIDDFSGYKFKIEKYCPIALDDGIVSKIEYDDLEDKKVSSIFSVVKSFDSEKKIMSVINDDKKIKIELPEHEYENFDRLNGQIIFQHIFFSIIIIPALSMCLKEIQDEIKYQNKMIEDVIDSHTWFISVQNAYKKLTDTTLTEEIFLALDVLELSQMIMDNCVVNSIDDFHDIITRTTDTDEEEYINE